MLEGLQLGVGVRADFAVEVDLFVLRSNPFHEQCSLRKFNDKRQDSTGAWKEEEGNPSGLGGVSVQSRHSTTSPNECLLIKKQNPRNRFRRTA